MEGERQTQAQTEESVQAKQQHDRAELLRELISEMQRSTDVSTFFLHFVAAQTGIHVTDMKVLSLIERLGPLNASRIADLSGLTTGAITFVLDRLEKLGYARRVRSAKDRRVVLMEINSEALEDKIGKYFMRMAEVTTEAATQLTDEQLSLIVHFTQKLNTLAEEVLQGMKNDSK
ncbi:MarR family winged helix-turn-helix transcriptional regulator [Ktedonospora formicarum]|uniref:MarR family winged helix-turn-helix transcriptional regulator n=1 Tax=Ktedonospora formicarum TaxID=2778364 RepID=UPI001C68790C|nr:MarR family transcriptional regulator [Ktedonospora formicarum]